MSDTTQTAAQAIDALAAKLAVPVAHLWAVLVRQVYIDAVTESVVAVLACAPFAAAFYCARRWWGERSGGYTDDTDIRRVLLVFLCVASTIPALVQGSNAIYAISHLANPEYAALREVLKAVSR